VFHCLHRRYLNSRFSRTGEEVFKSIVVGGAIDGIYRKEEKKDLGLLGKVQKRGESKGGG